MSNKLRAGAIGATGRGDYGHGTDGAISLQYAGGIVLSLKASQGPMEHGSRFERVDTHLEAPPPGSAPIDSDHFIHRGNRLAIADLIDAVIEDRDPVCSGRDARWAAEMVQGVYASHLSRRRLALPLVERVHPLNLS